MKSVIFWSLAVLNAVLLCSLASHFGRENTAVAQPTRRPADYAMIPGRIQSGADGLVYVIDSSTGVLGALNFDGRALNTMQPVDMTRVFEAAGAPRRH